MELQEVKTSVSNRAIAAGEGAEGMERTASDAMVSDDGAFVNREDSDTSSHLGGERGEGEGAPITVMELVRAKAGLLAVACAAIMEIVAAHLPLYSSASHSFIPLEYESVVGSLVAFFLLAAVALLLLAIEAVIFLLYRKCMFGRTMACCSYGWITCACIIALAGLLSVAVFFPSMRESIFGGPNQLGADLGYALGSGYYLECMALGMALGGAVLELYYCRTRAAMKLRPMSHTMALGCKLVLFAAVVLAGGWMAFVLQRVTTLGNCRGVPASRIAVPPGFTVSVFANVQGARSITLAAPGWVVVGSRQPGNVYAVHTASQRVSVIFAGGDQPNGVAYREEMLYIVEVSTVLRVSWSQVQESISTGHPLSRQDAVLVAELPTERHHGWRYARFSPEGLLFVSIGAPCNICLREEENREFASIIALAGVREANGNKYATRRIVARGIRNSVGFTFGPDSGGLWFTDNGGDWLGDDLPPDELNFIPQAVLDGILGGNGTGTAFSTSSSTSGTESVPAPHYGFPHCYGHANSPYGPDFNPAQDCTAYLPANVALGPHVAALGIRHYPSAPPPSPPAFPPPYHGKLTFAEHGSWNRRDPIGYRVMVSSGEEGSYEELMGGFLSSSGKGCGRPVDVEVLEDGSMLVSDDHASVLWRVAYQPPT